MALINKARLEQYLKLNYNVLFIGEHGVGKTMVVKELFDKLNLRWKYFSASTLDPWVDFVGVPKVIDVPGKASYLDLIRPSFIQNDEVDAIFFDELNRAPDKVINAIMELIQFKSINGHKLQNLKVIWAAINPEDEADTYSVNHLDPAHLDRFHVHMKVPFKLDDDYLKGKYPDHAGIFIEWWNDLPLDIKKLCSPRRVEYTIQAHLAGCRVEDFIPTETNPKKLRDALQVLPFAKNLSSIADQSSAEAFLRDSNNMMKLLELVKIGNSNAIVFFQSFGKLMPKELVEPFVEVIAAKKNGVEIVSSLKELIEKLPGDKGNSGTSALINAADLVGMCSRTNTTLPQCVTDLAQREPHVLQRLANQMVDVIFTCKTETLQRAFWGLKGKESNAPTNFQKLISIIGNATDLLSQKQVQVLNQKLYEKKIIDTTRFIQRS